MLARAAAAGARAAGPGPRVAHRRRWSATASTARRGDALGRALLALGRTEEGFKQFEEWEKDSPESADALKGYALALMRMGQTQQAEAESNRAAKLVAE